MTLTRDIMTREPRCIGENDSLSIAASLMSEIGVGSLPIYGEDGKLTGVLTDRDIVIKAVADGLDPETTPARTLASGNVVTVDASDDVTVALERMRSHRVHRVLVMENRVLVGIISQSDVARALSAEATGITMQSISQQDTTQDAPPPPPADDLARLSELARAESLRIAVVESLTSGRLANTVGNGDEARSWFVGGITAYMTEVKQRLLGLAPGVDPCSAECAEQLALSGLNLFGADICVSTTGIAGPDSQDGHEPGTVYLGWATTTSHGHVKLVLDGDPDDVLDDTVSAALSLLLANAEHVSSRAREPGTVQHVE